MCPSLGLRLSGLPNVMCPLSLSSSCSILLYFFLSLLCVCSFSILSRSLSISGVLPLSQFSFSDFDLILFQLLIRKHLHSLGYTGLTAAAVPALTTMLQTTTTLKELEWVLSICECYCLQMEALSVCVCERV